MRSATTQRTRGREVCLDAIYESQALIEYGLRASSSSKATSPSASKKKASVAIVLGDTELEQVVHTKTDINMSICHVLNHRN